jgi:hypothetical protein
MNLTLTKSKEPPIKSRRRAITGKSLRMVIATIWRIMERMLALVEMLAVLLW